MNTLRFPSALVGGLLIATLMFWLQLAMISRPVTIPAVVIQPPENFTQLREPAKPEPPPREVKVVREPTAEVPGRVPIDIPHDRITTEKALPPVRIGKPGTGGIDPIIGGAGTDTVATVLVRIEPEYPPHAIARNIEGWVQIQFTITASGATRDPVVVAAEPADVFENAALKAIARWRYNPMVVDGVPVERVGMQTVIQFELEN